MSCATTMAINAICHYYKIVEFVPDNQNASEIWLRLAQSHYQQSEWSKVLTSLSKYQTSQGKMGSQQLSLKLGSQLQLKRWEQAIPTLEALIEIEPNKLNWWRQMVSLQLKLSRNNQALDTLALAKLQKVELTDSEKRLLAQLYAQRGIPERAAIEISQLNGAYTDVALLVEQATYWQYAKEWSNAVDIWLIAAKQDSQYYWNAALLLSQQGNYSKALAQLYKIDKNASPHSVTDIALAKVRAYYKLGQHNNALIEAKSIREIAKTQSDREQVEAWYQFLRQKHKKDLL
ncbi:tetratricopeptide repeat protein [Vibrio algarum]|uniref:Tetratricopeptide repeat protein n=1 Tax=Vibrio algarum TaxID=3020714 RepID=A0ABT4YPC5_9VIBR|nr:hypothetical protein [Vibrio sp. KJ40-1]MDB1123395.1 hypothetical protein [Vibrio sp. KJ40-1]